MRRLVVGLWILAPAFAPPAFAQQPGGVAVVEGRFSIVWGDPRAGTSRPVHLFRLLTDDGRILTLDVTPDQLVNAGGMVPLNGQRVRVTLDAEDAKAANTPPGARAPRQANEPPIKVRALRSVGALPQSHLLQSGRNRSQQPVSHLIDLRPRPYAILLCRYRGGTAPASFTPAGYAPIVRDMTAHYLESTGGRTDMSGTTVYGPFELPKTEAEYAPAPDALQFGPLFDDCTRAADATVDFSRFSGVVLQLSGNFGCCSFGGGGTIVLDGPFRPIGVIWNGFWADLGTYVHEVGHSMGLPHSSGPYDRVYDSPWDPMSGGGSGVHTVIWHKDVLQAVDLERAVVATGVRTTARLVHTTETARPGEVNLVAVPWRTDPSRFYTLEARVARGWDMRVPAQGILINSINLTRPEPAWVVDADGNRNLADEGVIWRPGEAFRDRANDIWISIDSAVPGGWGVTVQNLAGVSISASPRELVPYQVAAGSSTSRDDQAQVLVQAPAGTTLSWQVSARAGWIRLLTTQGTGSGTLRWRIDPAGIGAGTYSDTLTVQLTGLSSAPARIPVRLIVGGSAGTRLALSATVRRDSAPFLDWSLVESTKVVIEPAGGAVPWTVTRGNNASFKFARPVPATGGFEFPEDLAVSGTGSGWFYYVRTPYPRNLGTYVDTLVVTATGVLGSPAYSVHTLRVFDSIGGRIELRPPRRALQTGGLAPVDSFRLRWIGHWATALKWTGYRQWWSPSPQFLYAITGGGVGDGWVKFRRDASKLAAGTYVDTIRIAPLIGGWWRGPLFVDTLVVGSGAQTLVVTPRSRYREIISGSSPSSIDSVNVNLSGNGSVGGSWAATSPSSRVFVHSIRSPGTLVWSRDVSGLTAGLYVVELRVVSTDGQLGPVAVLDSLRVLPPAKLATGLVQRLTFALTGDPAARDSLLLPLEGTESAEIAWTATNSAPWLTLNVRSGTGPRNLTWTVNLTSLGAGNYLDTIAVHAPFAFGSPLRIVQALEISAPPAWQALGGSFLGASLPPSQQQYYDRRGNRNGQFDIGDLWAYRTAVPGSGLNQGAVAGPPAVVLPRPAPRSMGNKVPR